MIRIEKHNDYKGIIKITIPYNLKIISAVIGGLIAITALGFLGWGLVLGLCWLWFDVITPFACWIADCAIAFWDWICDWWLWIGIIGAGGASYLLYRNKDKITPEQKDAAKRYLPWVAAVIAVILLCLFCMSKCSKDEEITVQEVETVAENNFKKDILSDVVKVRAYLYGTQTVATKDNKFLGTGIWNIDVKEVEVGDCIPEGITIYNWSLKVIQDDWVSLLRSEVNVELKYEQQITTVIAASIMGKTGFKNSKFLACVNKKDFESAYKNLEISKRKMTNDEKAQFYMLKLIWSGDISIDEIMSLPYLSHLNIPVNKLYTSDKEAIYNKESKEYLRQKYYNTNGETASQLLEL